MKLLRLLVVMGMACALLLMPMFGVSAQDATPEGTPAAECVAPELPEGTPSDPSASPTADGGMDMEAGDAPVAEGPASQVIAASGEAALQNLVNCFNASDWAGVAALLTPNMLVFIGGTENPYDTIAAFGVNPPSPIVVIDAANPVIDTNNRIGLSIVYSGLFNGPGIQSPEKWYFVRDGDTLKLDEVVASQMPADLYPDATIVTVEMVDFAFALDMNTIPTGPVIFRFSNTSFSGQPHVGVMVTLTEGITSEQVITGDGLSDNQMTGFVNALFLMPGKTADYYVENLAPGTYTLVCDLTTPDGMPHWKLGMVAQFTVE